MTKTESFTYDYLGRALTFNSARLLEGSLNVPYTWKKEYDYQGNVIKEFNAEENFISKEYNVFGQLEKIYDYKSNLSNHPYAKQNTYDDLGRLIKVEIPFEEKDGTIHY